MKVILLPILILVVVLVIYSTLQYPARTIKIDNVTLHNGSFDPVLVKMLDDIQS